MADGVVLEKYLADIQSDFIGGAENSATNPPSTSDRNLTCNQRQWKWNLKTKLRTLHSREKN